MAKQAKPTATSGAPASPLAVTDYEVLWVPVGSLTHNPKNYRRHGEDHILTLRQSLREHGWEQVVIVDPRDHSLILDGHGREIAAQAEGLATMPVHVYHGVSPEKWIVTANESDRQAEVDGTALAALLADVQRVSETGLEGTGYDDSGLDALVATLATEAAYGTKERSGIEGGLRTNWGNNDKAGGVEYRVTVPPEGDVAEIAGLLAQAETLGATVERVN